MKLIFIFAVILFEVFFIHLFQVVEVVGAFGVDALVDDEVLAVCFGDQGIPTMGAPQLYRGEAAFIGREPGITDLAEKLPFRTVILVEERFWGTTARAGAGIGDVALGTAADRADLFTLTLFKVRDEFLIGPVLPEISDERKLINFELLIFRGMGIIESPLPERDIPADKVNQPAVLLIKILNNRE